MNNLNIDSFLQTKKILRKIALYFHSTTMTRLLKSQISK